MSKSRIVVAQDQAETTWTIAFEAGEEQGMRKVIEFINRSEIFTAEMARSLQLLTNALSDEPGSLRTGLEIVLNYSRNGE